jgi:hypothetical protein
MKSSSRESVGGRAGRDQEVLRVAYRSHRHNLDGPEPREVEELGAVGAPRREVLPIPRPQEGQRGGVKVLGWAVDHAEDSRRSVPKVSEDQEQGEEARYGRRNHEEQHPLVTEKRGALAGEHDRRIR